jgi:hypothetical protein
MPKETRALSEEFTKIGGNLIATMPELEHIKDSRVRIAFLESDYDKRSNCKSVYGECEKIADKNKWALKADFTITLYAPNIEGFSEKQIAILLFHELLHVGIDYREGGEEVYSIRPHDVEDFKVIIEKYGVDWAERTVI